MTTDFDLEYDIFKDLILENNSNADMDLIKKAYYFGELNHRGQKGTLERIILSTQ